jgi:hypothetical protein
VTIIVNGHTFILEGRMLVAVILMAIDEVLVTGLITYKVRQRRKARRLQHG